MPPCSACEHWSAPYDGTNPSPEQYRSDTPGNDTDEEDDVIVQQVKGDSCGYLTISPPPTAPSPSLSSSDTVSTGNQTGRASSVLELEWDDIFADDDPSLSAVFNKAPARAFTPMPPPLPPRYIQEMRRTATKLVHGSYVEESEFQDDVLVYDLVAQKDTKAAILERIMAANRQARAGLSHRVSSITAGMTIMETVSSVMSSKRRSEVGGEEEGKLRDRGEEGGNEAEDGIRMADIQGKLNGHQLFFSGNSNSECDKTDEDGTPVKPQCNRSDQQRARLRTQPPPPCFPNGHPEPESPDFMASPSRPGSGVSGGDDFLSRYCELMRSLGVEPDCDDITDDVGTFRKRIRALKLKVDEDEDGETIESLLSSLRAEGEDAMMEEGEGEEEEEEKSISDGVRRVPFTGPLLNQNFDTVFLAAC